MKRFFRSFVFAVSGIRDALKSELSLRIHLLATVVAIALGTYLKLPATSWGFVILGIGSVLAAELFNTAIERLGDEAAGGQQKLNIRHAKDTAAGAVLISAVMALAIGIIFIIVPLVNKIFD
jgi:diacylglycerol kinase